MLGTQSQQSQPTRKLKACHSTHCWMWARWEEGHIETWIHVEHDITEQWQSWNVEINKIIKGFPYLVATDIIAPPKCTPTTQEVIDSVFGLMPMLLAKACQQWAWYLTRQKEHQAHQATESWAICTAMLDSGATSNFIPSGAGFKLSSPSNKAVTVANGLVIFTIQAVKLPLRQLHKKAWKAHVMPALSQQALMSVKVLADNG